jgi:hypothetical protein
MLLHALLLAAPVPARAQLQGNDRSLVPGRMGYNALPAIPLADAEIGDELELELAAAAQLSDLARAGDAALTPYLRLSVPFRRVAALDVEATPVEFWRVEPSTQQRLGAVHGSGVSKGDLRFAARFALFAEGERMPAVTLRALTKTATGKSLEDRRFLDAPAYGVDGLFGKTLPWALGPFDSVRVLASVGALIWQQGNDGQDDALTAGARVQLTRRGRTRVALEWRAYWGYQQQDSPALLGITLGQRLTDVLELAATANRGLTSDAPPWELRLGLLVRLASFR